MSDEPIGLPVLLKGAGATGLATDFTLIKKDDEDEGHLLARVRRGDLTAFEALYRAHHPRLERFISGLIGRPPLVQEILNDTMMVLWERADSFRGDSKLSTWLFGIAYRKAMRAVSRYDEPVEDDGATDRSSDDAGPEHEVCRQHTSAALLDAIAQLSPDHRTVVDLTYFHDLGYREIAEIMVCPVDTVKTRMFHARRHLKRKLAGEMADWL